MRFVVLFEVKVKQGALDEYLRRSKELKSILGQMEGFVSAERFSSLADEGKLLSMSVWEGEEALSTWRNTEQHRQSQAVGRNNLFDDYTVTVAKICRQYGIDDRDDAPNDSNVNLEMV